MCLQSKQCYQCHKKTKEKTAIYLIFSVRQSSLPFHRFLSKDTKNRVFRCTEKKSACCWRMPVGRYSGQGCEKGRPCECTPANQGQTSALVTVASRTPRNTHCIDSHGHYQCQPNIYPPPTPANAQTLTVRMIMKPQVMSGSLPTPVWGPPPEASLHILKVER